MTIVQAMLEVSRDSYAETHPSLHLNWFEGISLNGNLITDWHIAELDQTTFEGQEVARLERWKSFDVSAGVDCYTGFGVCFAGFDSAKAAYSDGYGRAWEIAPGVFLILCSMPQQPIQPRINIAAPVHIAEDDTSSAAVCVNHYECPRCQEAWELESDSQHDDRCQSAILLAQQRTEG